MLRWFLGILLCLCTLTIITAWWFHNEMSSPYYGASSPETFVEIPKGAGTEAIAKLLVDAGIIHHKYPFLFYLRWTGGAVHLKAGEYRFISPATTAQIVRKLTNGEVYYIPITIPEGLTARETIKLIAAANLGNLDELQDALLRTEWIRDLDPSARNLEGFLFPETYRFPRRTTSEEIIKALVDQFHVRFNKIISENPPPPAWSNSRIVTLASMIEKEVKTPSERPIVASVLVNRLSIGMPLACDPTIIYALKLTGSYDGNLHKADLSLKSPYNTYIVQGLPPGPIANPGEASLRAALSPAHDSYLYYVSRNDGTHQFSKDFRSHQIAVMRFQKGMSHTRH